MKTPAKLVPLIPALLVLLVSLWALGRAPALGLGAPLACDEAQLVAGELRCGAELLGDLRELCGADEAFARALGPGDAVGVGACLCSDPGRLSAHARLLERSPPRSTPPLVEALAERGLGCDLGVARMGPDELAALEQIVDLNRASAAELTSLPGVGPTIAGRIVARRPYASVDELLDVRGVGPKRLAAARARVVILPVSPPVSPP